MGKYFLLLHKLDRDKSLTPLLPAIPSDVATKKCQPRSCVQGIRAMTELTAPQRPVSQSRRGGHSQEWYFSSSWNLSLLNLMASCKVIFILFKLVFYRILSSFYLLKSDQKHLSKMKAADKKHLVSLATNGSENQEAGNEAEGMLKGKGSSHAYTSCTRIPLLMLLFSPCREGKVLYYTKHKANQYPQIAASTDTQP